MITVRIKGKDVLRACVIEDLEAELDEENKEVNIYYKNELLGPLAEVYGISDEKFMNKIKYRGE